MQTVNEILEIDEFEKILWEKIELELARRNRTLKFAPATSRLKSDPLFTLDKKGRIFPGSLAAEFKLICIKKSELSRKERDFILNFVIETLKAYQIRSQNGNNRKKS
jgi:hypothetical protein